MLLTQAELRVEGKGSVLDHARRERCPGMLLSAEDLGARMGLELCGPTRGLF